MGLDKSIKNLLKEAKIHKIPFYKFYQLRIGIDLSIWIHKNKAVAYSRYIDSMKNPLYDEINESVIINTLLTQLKYTINNFLQYGITPIFIFDGKRPDGKLNTVNKRVENKEKKIKELGLLKSKLLGNISVSNDDMNKLKSLLKYTYTVGKNDIELIINILDNIGIPYIIANGEAEELGCTLCRYGIISSFYSTDSDCLAHECTNWINKYEYDVEYDDNIGKKVSMFNLYYYADILQHLELTNEQFKDLCIVSGCDYNTKIPRFTGKRVYDAIKQYNCYNNFPVDKKHDSHNYEYCLQMFTTKNLNDIIDINNINLNINKDKLKSCRTILDYYDFNSWIEELSYYYEHMPIPLDNVIFNPYNYKLYIDNIEYKPNYIILNYKTNKYKDIEKNINTLDSLLKL